MQSENLQRMIRLADEFFGTKRDREQISVTERDVAKLKRIHPATMTEETNADGPIVWILIFPTTTVLMNQFLRKEINEQELLDETPVGERYEAIYLCSALVLPEYRGKGLAMKSASKAVRSIVKDHPIKNLFFWGFSSGGRRLAAALAKELMVPLLEREDHVVPSAMPNLP